MYAFLGPNRSEIFKFNSTCFHFGNGITMAVLFPVTLLFIRYAHVVIFYHHDNSIARFFQFAQNARCCNLLQNLIFRPLDVHFHNEDPAFFVLLRRILVESQHGRLHYGGQGNSCYIGTENISVIEFFSRFYSILLTG